jgi:hypothetical protein
MGATPFPQFDAYRGSDPYTFVSYAHADSVQVYPEIARLHEEGCHIWFDEGIDPGDGWPDAIADALIDAAVFLVFISPRSATSRNVKSEINFALNIDKPILAVHLEETRLPSGLALRLGDIQAILRYRLSAETDWRKLFSALRATIKGQMSESLDLRDRESASNRRASTFDLPIIESPSPSEDRVRAGQSSRDHEETQPQGESKFSGQKQKPSFSEPGSLHEFKLPSTALLTWGLEPPAIREDELRQEAMVLETKCLDFGVRGKMVQINPGPTVTTYEFKPAEGVKYSRVLGLAEDLGLTMPVESILIERMAGKGSGGIQVPNRVREIICLRDVLESDTFAGAKSRLTLAMGRNENSVVPEASFFAPRRRTQSLVSRPSVGPKKMLTAGAAFFDPR